MLFLLHGRRQALEGKKRGSEKKLRNWAELAAESSMKTREFAREEKMRSRRRGAQSGKRQKGQADH